MSSPFGISCASAADCVVTGDAALTTTNGGKTWARHAAAGSAARPVTCPSTRDCYAVFKVTSAVPSNEQTYLYTSTNGGVTWKDVLAKPRHVAGLPGISCPTTTICVAVGNGYTPPQAAPTPCTGSPNHVDQRQALGADHGGQGPGLFADSCAAATRDCIAGGQTSAGAVTEVRQRRGTWTSEPLPRA